MKLACYHGKAKSSKTLPRLQVINHSTTMSNLHRIGFNMSLATGRLFVNGRKDENCASFIQQNENTAK
jgi:hypothetical protein